MTWITVPGLDGKVYVPGDAGGILTKHPCKECFSCQWCDENRCRVCRSDRSGAAEIEGQRRCRHKQPDRPASRKDQAPERK